MHAGLGMVSVSFWEQLASAMQRIWIAMASQLSLVTHQHLIASDRLCSLLLAEAWCDVKEEVVAPA